MATKRISFAEGLKLMLWRVKYTFAKNLLARVEQTIEKLRQEIVTVHDFIGIPVESPKGIDIKLEAGPDENGLVEVEWQEADDATS